MSLLAWLDENKGWLAPGGGIAVIGASLRWLGLGSPTDEPPSPASPVHCDFCGRSQQQVRKIIRGPNHTHICDECIDLSTEIIDFESADDRASSVAAVCNLTVRLVDEDISPEDRHALQQRLDHHARIARPNRRPRSGDTLCGARLDRVAGAGTFGTVWEAHGESGESIAVKIFDPDKIALGVMLWRFQRGIRAMQHLTNLDRVAPRSICRIGEVAPDRLAFAMEFLPGGDLTKLRRWAWSPEKKGRVFLSVAKALSFSHNDGIVHRDVKPANIVLDSEGNAVLTDFDIADLTFAATMSVSSAALGTPHFAAPEQLLEVRAPAHPTADIFSLGKLLYYLIAEASPPLGAMWASELSSQLVPDRRMREIIERCTHTRASQRFQNVNDLVAELPTPLEWPRHLASI